MTTSHPDGLPTCEQATWRREFPIDVPEDNYLARRSFLRFLVLTSLAFVVGQVWIYLQSLLRRRAPVQPHPVARLEEIPIGGVKTFTYPAPHDSCLLVRPDAETLLAYSQKCTHLSCAVTPDVAGALLHCPCHKGVFDLATGRPLAGPPRRPLARIPLEVRDGVIYAQKVEPRTV